MEETITLTKEHEQNFVALFASFRNPHVAAISDPYYHIPHQLHISMKESSSPQKLRALLASFRIHDDG